WDDAAEHAEALAAQLASFQAPEGQGPAGRSPQLPGMGSLLLPPWTMTRYDPDGVEMRGHFTRFHVGGNGAVHGGVPPLPGRSAAPASCTSTTARSPRSTPRWSSGVMSPRPKAARRLSAANCSTVTRCWP